MENGKPIKDSLYIYAPNKVAPVFFTVAFTLLLISHTWQCYHWKCFKLTWLHSMCASLFAVGFALREYGAFNYLYTPDVLIVYIVSIVLIYVAPPLLELVNYHVLGRIFLYIPHLAPLNPHRVLATFGLLSFIVEGVNSLGASFIANPTSSAAAQRLGRGFTITALAMQLVIIVVFISLTAVFHRRAVRAGVQKRVETCLWTMYVSALLILTRTVYRTIEQSGNTARGEGADLADLSPLLRYEWYFYAFEATPMCLNSLLWTVMHPRRWLPEGDNIHLAEDGVTEVETPAKKDGRPLLAQILDPYGLVIRKRKYDNSAFLELQSLTRPSTDRGHEARQSS